MQNSIDQLQTGIMVRQSVPVPLTTLKFPAAGSSVGANSVFDITVLDSQLYYVKSQNCGNMTRMKSRKDIKIDGDPIARKVHAQEADKMRNSNRSDFRLIFPASKPSKNWVGSSYLVTTMSHRDLLPLSEL
jgi:hypothetical protein